MTIEEALKKKFNIARRTNNAAGQSGTGQLITWDCGCQEHSADGQILCDKHNTFPEPFLPKTSWRTERGLRNVIALEDGHETGGFCWVELAEEASARKKP